MALSLACRRPTILRYEPTIPDCHCGATLLLVNSRERADTDLAELQVLKDIITAAFTEEDGTSFLAVFKAYDAVLKARDIDPAKDRVYFKFLLKLARVEGTTWMDKFDHLLEVSPFTCLRLNHRHFKQSVLCRPFYSPDRTG